MSCFVKKNCGTSWLNKNFALNAVHRELPKVILVLKKLVQMKKNEETYQRLRIC